MLYSFFGRVGNTVTRHCEKSVTREIYNITTTLTWSFHSWFLVSPICRIGNSLPADQLNFGSGFRTGSKLTASPGNRSSKLRRWEEATSQNARNDLPVVRSRKHSSCRKTLQHDYLFVLSSENETPPKDRRTLQVMGTTCTCIVIGVRRTHECLRLWWGHLLGPD